MKASKSLFASPNIKGSDLAAKAVDYAAQSFASFSAVSRFKDLTVDGFSAVTIKAAGALTGLQVFTQGPVNTPAAAVPETATWAMMISGFGLIGGAMRRHKSAIAKAAWPEVKWGWPGATPISLFSRYWIGLHSLRWQP
jgi:hypothetical protein